LPHSEAKDGNNQVFIEKAEMNEPNLFDVVELSVDLPEENLTRGTQGTIMECYEDGTYEVEFMDDEGETLALGAVSPEQVRVVYRHQADAEKEKAVQKLLAIVNSLDKKGTEEVLDFANSLRQRQAVAQ
jgi:hypothetical protein